MKFLAPVDFALFLGALFVVCIALGIIITMFSKKKTNTKPQENNQIVTPEAHDCIRAIKNQQDIIDFLKNTRF